MQQPVRVLQVLGGLDAGGAESFVMNLYRAVDRRYVQFDFVKHVPRAGLFEPEINRLGGRIFCCPQYTGKNHFAYLRWWREFFASHPEYKVIHGHVRSTAALYLSVAKRCGRVTIAHSHSTSNGKGVSAFVKNVMQLPIRSVAEYLFACSDEAGAWLYGKSALNRANYRRIPNGIDLGRFAFDAAIRARMRASLGIPEGTLVLGHIGRFSQPKNHGWLVNLFAEWHKRDANSCLLLVGNGELWEEIHKQCAAMGIADKVLMPGACADTENYYQAMDIFVFPSLWEGLPVSVVEAQANGLTCLISEVITPEVQLTDLVQALPTTTTEPWLERLALCRCRQQGKLTDAQQRGLQPFAVQQVARELQEFYCEQWKKAGGR